METKFPPIPPQNKIEPYEIDYECRDCKFLLNGRCPGNSPRCVERDYRDKAK